MDEGTLNDLLECSVCLDRLDTSSRVLPCQHTFCRKCLEEIVHKHKELRCPECRILVNIKLEDLPPNVLLMRILEGMKNAIPKRAPRGGSRGGSSSGSTGAGGQNANAIHQNAQVLLHGTPDRKINNKQNAGVHPVVHQPYAKALYDYEPKEPGDLSFKRGDVIYLRKRIDTHWFQGECAGKQGLFPLSYVQIITPLPSHIPQCKALYDFQTDKHEEEGCLVFKEGDIINVIRRVDENWAEGKLDGRIGIFPLTFVELNNLARSLMKLSTNAQPGPSRLAPPTPTTEDSTPLIPTDHSRVIVAAQQQNLRQQQQQQQQQQLQQPQQQQQQQQTPAVHQNMPTSDSSSTVSSGSSSTTTPNVSSSNTSSNSSTAPSSPASPPPRNQASSARTMAPKPDLVVMAATCSPVQRSPDSRSSHNKEKRHSFTGLTPPTYNKPSHRHSAEIPSQDTQSSTSTTSTTTTTASLPEQQQRPSRRNNNGGSGGGSAISSNTHDDIKLPAAYVALYPYKPQKGDELELRKGGVYMVTERCQDGWYKGTSNRTQKCGVFPGNYVEYMGPKADSKSGAGGGSASSAIASSVSYTRSGKGGVTSAVTSSSSSSSRHHHQQSQQQQQLSSLPPELPPRSVSPALSAFSIATGTTIKNWQQLGQQHTLQQQQDCNNTTTAAVPITSGRNNSSSSTNTNAAHMSLGVRSATISAANAKQADKQSKDRKEKGVGLMRRLASMKRSKSPPPSTYSMDNPVFEDTVNVATAHPVHVRSGSCPSQLLQIQPAEHHRLFGSTSQRLKHKERPSVLPHNLRAAETPAGSSNSSPDVHHHRKSNSLDAGNRTKTVVQTVHEVYKCEIPYPPNTEYELELQKDDLIYVHKKREDGWYKGTLQRTGRTGLFPASFVRPA